MLKFIFKFAKKYWLSLSLMLIFTVFSAKINLELPQYTSKIITQGVAMKNMEAIYSNGFHMIGLSLLSGVLMLAGIFFASRSAGAMARDIRHETFKKIEDFSMSEFGKFSVASLTTRITNDARQFQQTFTMIMRMGIYAPIIGAGAIINTLAISGSMSWIMAITVFSIIVLTTIIGVFAVPKLRIFQTKLDKLNMQTRQTITGLRVIRAYRKEKVEEEKFGEINAEMLKMNVFFERIFGLISPYMTMVSGLGLVAIAWIGSYFVKSGEISIGDVASLTQYLAQVTFAFVMLSMIFMSIPRMNVAIKRLSEVLDEEILIKDKAKTKKAPKTFELAFENVSFAYPDSEEAVLEDINFEVQQGQTIAVIGGTGSGKSTIAKLIPRFYDVSKGKIKLGGVDIRDLKQSELHDLIGYVPQKASLFSGNVRENINYGSSKHLTDEEIIEALKIAQAWDFVQKLPEDLNEKVSQGGKNFSGGQKQRLSIARAIASKAPILIFDDSFSALDYKTDAKLRAELASKTKLQTKFIVAQRVTSIMQADKIIVLDGGKIVGIGTHGELLEDNEIYREIASSQLSDEEIEAQIKEFEKQKTVSKTKKVAKKAVSVSKKIAKKSLKQAVAKKSKKGEK
ncbi:MAG: ABC transporter ATP-binding protein/permease [Candidatus Nanogingivalaceae bacterium]|nr:MAG: ABC transporter ATP-binding protein/permease [Candidatus Nanogingivalaceae bacterium]QWB91892.1 MAG: ABC transporter ATP-binding protein/permease [Candidatus Nanogingivalaceae bacterium]